MEFIKQSKIWVLGALSVCGYLFIAYDVRRIDHELLFGIFTSLFLVALLMMFHFQKHVNNWVLLFVFGLLFRLSFLFVPPQLSDDYFRFTWDGELRKDGISAFTFVPGDYTDYFKNDVEKQEKYKELFEATMDGYESDAPGMNSPGYYSIYPAVNQSIFYCASIIGSPNESNLVVMRIWILLAEIISFFILRLLLLKRNYSGGLSALYWLNPLVIIEITGNLHFDGVAITFILLALFYLQKERFTAAGISLALAIHTKLNPIFLIGAVFRKVSFNRLLLFASIGIVITALLFMTIMDVQGFLNFKKSFGLYFAWFSFNAGPFNLIKELGFLGGIDLSSIIGAAFPVVTILLFAFISIKSKKPIAHKLLLLYVVYFSFSPVVHPWYLTVLIPLGILSGKLYPLLWSFLAFFSYYAYGENYGESMIIIFIEYGLVYAMMYVEYKKNVPAIERLKINLFKNPISPAK